MKNLVDKTQHDFPQLPYNSFTEREYWNRVWIIQEIFHPENGLFLCGTKKPKFPHLCTTTVFQSQAQGFFNRSVDLEKLVDPITGPALQAILNSHPNLAIAQIVGCRRRCQSETGPPQTLMALLRRLYMHPRRPKATVPRDAIYGLLGMASDAKALDIKVDYNKTDAEAYMEIAKCFIKQGELGILAWCRKTESIRKMPSWVPPFGDLFQYPHGDNGYEIFFSASGSYLYVPAQLEEPTLGTNVLSLMCAKVDTIKVVGIVLAPKENGDFDYDIAKQFCEQIDWFCAAAEEEQLSPSYTKHHQGMPVMQPNGMLGFSTEGRLMGANWRVPCADQTVIDGRRYRATVTSQEGFYQFRQYLTGIPSTFINPRSPSCNAYYNSMYYQYGQRPFISHSGYVGLAPAKSRPGDSIYIVLGTTVPFVFHQQSDGYFELVGEAYVDSIMDGEFMSNSPNLETIRVI